MIRVTCDGCDEAIDRTSQRWFGVDLTPEPAEVDDDYEVEYEIEPPWTDHEFHFCSAACLSAWAFNQELTEDT